jgi:dipeptidyl aminopeptidase/acylaminoacyl peptidase
MLGPCARGQQSTPAADSFKPELVLQTGQNTAATSIAFSSDGRLIASGGYFDISIHVWETATGRQLRVLSKHGNTSSPYFSGVTAIALSRDGKFVAGGFKDNSVTIWDLNSGEELAEMATSIALPAMALLAIQFSPDGKYLLTAYAEGTTTLWDLSTGNKIREIKNGVYGATCNSATFTADGREVVSISGAVPAVVVKRGDAGAKTHVVSTDVLTGKETPVVDLPELLPGKAMGRCFVTSTTDGRILVSTSTSEAEKIWDVGSKSEPRILLHATPERVSSQTLSPSGQIAAFAQHAKLYVWDLTRSAQIYAVSIEANKTFEQGNEISSLEFSSAADRLLISA